ncbi:MAG: 3D-(3,5/4)-trihydroxycyclohexane-1,2-dione acylhydrolase (decyclizing) [Granulosicoccaceae bacterium]
MNTIKLTTAQALVRFLAAQHVEIEGQIKPLFAGVWAIFGHGNVPALGEALHGVREQLPTYRGHNEQSMAHAAIGFAKQSRRQQMMAVSSSIGPGATNMVTAAALAHVNRLPVLFLPGDVFVDRRPDPVLQQVENFNDPNINANDCFRPVSRYFDRFTKPEQLITSLPQAMAVLTDAELCGPVTLCLPQDVQAESFDYPLSFFEPVVHRQQRLGADPAQLARVAAQIKAAKKPVLVAGGGVHYSGAVEALRAFAATHAVPVVETSAGKGAMRASDAFNAGGIGVVGASSANALVQEADLLLTVGTRLSDFSTGSRTALSNVRVPQINLNVGHFDAHKHQATALRCDALRGLEELAPLLQNWRSDAGWVARINEAKTEWAETVAAAIAPSDGLPSDAQVTGLIIESADTSKDVLVVAAGSMPAEGVKLWPAEHSRGYHAEYGFSCMGYEIAGGLGVKMAHPDGEVYVVVGDGSYLMLNSEIASAVALRQKLIIMVHDNRGFGCINRLQNGCGQTPFNNLLDEGTEGDTPKIDFAAHARSLGATAEHVDSLAALPEALQRARASDNTYCICIDTNAVDSMGGGSWWQVGIPEVSSRESVTDARRDWQDAGKEGQSF